MADVKEFFNKFEKLQQKQLKAHAEKEVIEREKEQLLKEIPEWTKSMELGTLVANLEEELQHDIELLQIPKEHLDELTSIDDNV